jgi:hypothetical protein
VGSIFYFIRGCGATAPITRRHLKHNELPFITRAPGRSALVFSFLCLLLLPSLLYAAATKIVVSAISSPVTAGQVVPFTVSAVDDLNNTDTTYSSGTLTIGGTLGNAPNGTAPVYAPGSWSDGLQHCSFTAFKAESGRRIQASDSLLGSAESNAFAVANAAAHNMAVTTISNQLAGTAFNVTLNLTDSYGNPATNAGAVTTVSASAGSPTPSASLPPGHTWGSESQATTGDITITNVSVGVKLTAHDTVLGDVISNPFDVKAGTAHTISMAQIGNQVAGAAFSVTLTLTDSNGNPSTNPGGVTTLSVTGGSPAPIASLPGGYTWSGGESQATMGGITITNVSAGVKLTAHDTVLGNVDSNVFNVSASPPSSFTVAPIGDQIAGKAFDVSVSLKDSGGNPAKPAPNEVTTLIPVGIPAAPNGQQPILGSYTWSGNEPAGSATVSGNTIYSQCGGAKIKAHHSSVSGDVLSAPFNVVAGDPALYAISGPQSVRFKTKTTFTAGVKDQWGNPLTQYAGKAWLDCSDSAAYYSPSVSVANGAASFDVTFYSKGPCDLQLQDRTYVVARGSYSVTVDRPPLPALFRLVIPATVSAAVPFDAALTALDPRGDVLAEYSSTVSFTTDSLARITPGQVDVRSGQWQGQLSLSGEALQASIAVSDGEATTVSAATVRVAVSDYQKARAYPTVFTPRDTSLRIRYFLREDRSVTIKIYNIIMDLVREIDIPGGSSGGRSGLNVVEWDGRSGADNAVCHSGGYHILIDKGYEKEWIGAVVKNY